MERFRQPVKTCRPLPLALTALLVLSMLFGLWAGATHRIDHGGLDFAAAAETPAAQESRYGDWHSCAAFDAAAQGDVLALDFPLLLPASFSNVPPAGKPLTSTARRTACPFRSRAPPVA